MPFTPFHLGPTLLIALLVFPSLDLASFLVSSVIVDAEHGIGWGHGFFHSYLGASILGILAAAVMYSMRGVTERVLEPFSIRQRSSFRKTLLTSLLGVYSHVFLDSFLYGEMKPLYPLDFNPFLNAISALSIYALCSISLLLGLIVYVYRAIKAGKTSRSINHTSRPMKRLSVALLIVVVAAFLGFGFLRLWMDHPLFGEPRLRVNLASPPPSEVSPGDTFEMAIEVINEGGSTLRDLVVRLEMPEGFTESVTKTNTRIIGPTSLDARDGFGLAFVVSVSKDNPLGSYALRITATADNVSPQILSPSVKVAKK